MHLGQQLVLVASVLRLMAKLVQRAVEQLALEQRALEQRALEQLVVQGK